MELSGEGRCGAGVAKVKLHFDTVAGGEQSRGYGATTERSGDDGAGGGAGAAANNLRGGERPENVIGICVAIAGNHLVAGLRKGAGEKRDDVTGQRIIETVGLQQAVAENDQAGGGRRREHEGKDRVDSV